MQLTLDASGKREYPFEQLEPTFHPFASFWCLFFFNVLFFFWKVTSSEPKVDYKLL
jgi:hypothetical protein